MILNKKKQYIQLKDTLFIYFSTIKSGIKIKNWDFHITILIYAILLIHQHTMQAIQLLSFF